MKTLLIQVFDSNIVRNILRTNVLKILEASSEINKIIILTHPRKVEEYSQEFNSAKVIVDSYPSVKSSKLELLTWFLVRHTIHTLNVRRKIDEFRDRAQDYPVGKYWVALLVFNLSKCKLINRFIRWLTIISFNDQVYQKKINKYQPDLVFLPTLLSYHDVRLLKYCRKHKIKNIGMIKSWDNLLGKDPLLLFPDWLIVHNAIVKKQPMEMHGYPEERIYVSGIPHFDIYQDKAFVTPRDKFFQEMGLDSNKKLILYTAMGSWIVIHEKEVIEILAKLVRENKFKYPAQLLVRLHPAYLSEDEKLKEINGITIDRPGNSNFDNNPWRADFEFNKEDTRRLVNTFTYADVVINSGSTTTIDAACFDKPIINIAFDGYSENEKFERSARRLLEKDHYVNIVKTQGIRIVNNQEELIQQVNEYLENPRLDQAGRSRIVTEQCYKLDGKSGERVGNFILSKL